MSIRERENLYSLNCYPKRDLVIARGYGSRVWDSDNRSYIDCNAGHGVAVTGHCNPDVRRAVTEQLNTLVTCPGTFYNNTRAELLEKLVSLTPSGLTRAFLCNSGAEAIEAAIKFARISTGRSEFVCAKRSFHGRTMGALSATSTPKYRDDFKPLVDGFSFVKFNDFETIKEVVNSNTAAILLEPVQGEGGVYPADQEYLQSVESLCRAEGIMLIIDEVQTGFCRTGSMFASNHYNIEPDILCLSKAIAGGIPMGAVVCSDRIDIGPGKHGSTFGGNPMACSAALANIRFMERENLADQSREKGEYLVESLKRMNSPLVREIRGLGLMIGIELRVKSAPVIVELMNRGILALPGGKTVIRLLPPAVISYGEIDEVVNTIAEVLSDSKTTNKQASKSN